MVGGGSEIEVNQKIANHGHGQPSYSHGHGLLGIANGLAGDGMWYFFNDRLPKPMRFFAFPLTLAVLGSGRFLSAISILLAREWIGDTIEETHLDKYFLMLAILNIGILAVYIFLSYFCVWNVTQVPNESQTPMDEVDARVDN